MPFRETDSPFTCTLRPLSSAEIKEEMKAIPSLSNETEATSTDIESANLEHFDIDNIAYVESDVISSEADGEARDNAVYDAAYERYHRLEEESQVAVSQAREKVPDSLIYNLLVSAQAADMQFTDYCEQVAAPMFSAEQSI